MVLLAPLAFTPNSTAFAGALTAPDGASRARAILQAAYANVAAISPKQVDAYATGLSEGHMRVFSALALDLPHIASPPPQFASISSETLVIWGIQDRFLPPDAAPPIGGHARALCAALPHATLVEIPQCGHIPQEEKPAETNAAIAAFLP
jgi:pimeloyl-ACP methyl ester carboxylesterase